MPYKSTNKIAKTFHPLAFPAIIFISLLVVRSTSQSDCAKRPFPANISLRSNETILLNLDDYFDGSNLTFKVTPENSYSMIEPTYQCKVAGSQKIGKVIDSRYFVWSGQEVVAVRNALFRCWPTLHSLKAFSHSTSMRSAGSGSPRSTSPKQILQTALALILKPSTTPTSPPPSTANTSPNDSPASY